MQLITKLNQQIDFTTTEKRIADFILTNLNQVPQMLIRQLATATYTSHSAIIRLAQKLGYHGFRDFQRALTVEIAANGSETNQIDANFPFTADDSVATIATKMADLTINTVQSTREQLDTDQLIRAANQLTAARRIMLFSQGDSQLRARSFQNKLVKLDQLALIAEEYADQAWETANLTPADCALFISYAGTTHEHLQFAHYLHDQQIPLIVLTGNPASPLLALANIQLLTVHSEYNFAKIGTFASQAAFEYVLNTLFATMYAQNFRHNLQNLHQKQGLIQNGPLTTK